MNEIKRVLKKGIKQKCLVEKLNKSYNIVNDYVQNRQQPRLEILMATTKILDVDTKDLIISNKEKTLYVIVSKKTSKALFLTFSYQKL